MVISKGEPWGQPADRPDDLLEGDSDAEAARLVGSLPPEKRLIGLNGGDLLRTLGGRAGGGTAGLQSHRFPIDLGWITLDGADPLPFVAHVQMRRHGWRGGWTGPGAVVMNAAWVGPLYLGPRSHPNDGLLDITEGQMPVRQLLQARGRAKAGSHLPHPSLSTTRSAGWQRRFDRALPVLIDGVLAGRATEVEVFVEPDALSVFT